MLYSEQTPSRRWCYVHVALFVALFVPSLGVGELRRTEALVATVAAEMSESGRAWVTQVHGERVDAFPLPAWLVAACSGFGRPNEWTARLPAALAVLALAGLCGYAAARAAGHLAGAAAAGLVLTNVAMLSEGSRAGGETVLALLLCAAWLAWYRLGRVGKRWWAAWSVSLALVLLACYTSGIRALVYFYLPMFLLGRPLRALPRMRTAAHLVTLAWFGLALAVWLWTVPEQSVFPWRAAILEGLSGEPGSYLWRLASFPVQCAVDLLPWSLLAWPPFCVAFRPVERTPVLCRYLRTVVWAVFLPAWFTPGVSSRALLPLVGPLAVLTSLYYESLMRRYRARFVLLTRAMGWAAYVVGGVGVALGVLHGFGVVVVDGLPPVVWGECMVLLVAATWLGRWLRLAGQHRSYWLQLLLAVAACRFIYLGGYPALDRLWHAEHRTAGQVLGEAVPEGETVYKTVPGMLVTECYYTGRSVRQIVGKSGLPEGTRSRPVYVLAGGRPPILEPERRVWTACSPPVDLRTRRRPQVLWRPSGQGLIRLVSAPANEGEPPPQSVVRLYRGDLRQPATEAAPTAVDGGAGAGRWNGPAVGTDNPETRHAVPR